MLLKLLEPAYSEEWLADLLPYTTMPKICSDLTKTDLNPHPETGYCYFQDHCNIPSYPLRCSIRCGIVAIYPRAGAPSTAAIPRRRISSNFSAARAMPHAQAMPHAHRRPPIDRSSNGIVEL